MKQRSTVYAFRRDPQSLTGFLSTNTAAADAAAMAPRWSGGGAGRSYELLQHEPDADLLVISLSHAAADEGARTELDDLCEELGLARTRLA